MAKALCAALLSMIAALGLTRQAAAVSLIRTRTFSTLASRQT